MKKAENPLKKNSKRGGVASDVLEKLIKNPGVWFELSDEFQSHSAAKATLEQSAGRWFTPLKVVQRNGKTLVAWLAEEDE